MTKQTATDLTYARIATL